MAKQVTIVKANGSREAFEPEKLRASLLNSGANNEVAEKVVTHLSSELRDDMTTSEIYKHAFSVLNNMSRPVARSYSLRRAVMDLGPSGFPFEDFVAEILKAKGFTCLTRQTLLGGCVPHEVDVVAYNEKKLLIVEAKFHNELGTKSDLKVALYVKARFDDLRDNVYDYGRDDRKITDAWLVTNTKFSSTAIHYGLCRDLIMIGWNYPEKGNLQDMIEEEVLHPITCLSSLSSSDKKTLIEASVVLCSTIKKNPEILNQILGKKFELEPVINEINELYIR
ncbi:MAG: ATP cone domain-containing protein [bacterium]